MIKDRVPSNKDPSLRDRANPTTSGGLYLNHVLKSVLMWGSHNDIGVRNGQVQATAVKGPYQLSLPNVHHVLMTETAPSLRSFLRRIHQLLDVITAASDRA